jgi:hypothetical protein
MITNKILYMKCFPDILITRNNVYAENGKKALLIL